MPEEIIRNPLDKLLLEEAEKSGCDGLASQGLEPSMNQMLPNETLNPLSDTTPFCVLSGGPTRQELVLMVLTQKDCLDLLLIQLFHQNWFCVNIILQSEVICHRRVPDKKIPTLPLFWKTRANLSQNPLYQQTSLAHHTLPGNKKSCYTKQWIQNSDYIV